ncbi:MAG TPA: tetratricopeptide repeat protein [Steroidobacteraceae bacterium]|jgi:predicted Zn-dependent protease|nr:tetratricopeptide repeat protein [Steroidobacteraceae bacterium]
MQTLEPSRNLFGMQRRTLDPRLLGRFAEIGFLASEFGLHDAAQRLFMLLTQLREGHPSSLVALAMVRARAGRIEQAIEELRAVIAHYPECDLARAMLGTMLVHARLPGALDLFRAVIASNADNAAIQISEAWIDLAGQTEGTQDCTEPVAEIFRYHNVRP